MLLSLTGWNKFLGAFQIIPKIVSPIEASGIYRNITGTRNSTIMGYQDFYYGLSIISVQGKWKKGIDKSKVINYEERMNYLVNKIIEEILEEQNLISNGIKVKINSKNSCSAINGLLIYTCMFLILVIRKYWRI